MAVRGFQAYCDCPYCGEFAVHWLTTSYVPPPRPGSVWENAITQGLVTPNECREDYTYVRMDAYGGRSVAYPPKLPTYLMRECRKCARKWYEE